MWRLIPLLLTALGFFETHAPGSGEGSGATPGAGATPAQPSGGSGEGAKPEATPKPKADDELGEGGKKALNEEREARKAAERALAETTKRLEDLESGSQTEHERALTQARREAVAETNAKWAARVREAEVRGALRAAGITNEKFLGLAVAAPELRDLKVDNESGEVQGVSAAVDVFKEAYPEAFSSTTPAPPPPPPGGTFDAATGGKAGAAEPATLQDAVMQRMAQQERR